MKIYFVAAGFLIAVSCSANSGVSRSYSELLAISFDAPEIRAYVSDSAGHRNGVDPNVELESDGQQNKGGKNYSLREIENSYVTQENNDGSQAQTGWTIYIENPSGAYVLNYSSGLAQSAQEIGFDLQNFTSRKLFSTSVFLLAQNKEYKQLQITMSPTGIALIPIIRQGDFLRDTQTAIGLGAVSPARACEVLEDLASKIEEARRVGNGRVERESLEIYLNILNHLHKWDMEENRKDWDDLKGHQEFDRLRQKGLDDTKYFAKDPPYSALKLDAETLLRELPKEGRHKKVKDIGDNLGDDDKK